MVFVHKCKFIKKSHFLFFYIYTVNSQILLNLIILDQRVSKGKFGKNWLALFYIVFRFRSKGLFFLFCVNFDI